MTTTHILRQEVPFRLDETIARLRVSLAIHGFEVASDVDFKAFLKNRRDIDAAPHSVLNVCDPDLARQFMDHDPHLAACSCFLVSVSSSDGDGHCHIAMQDPSHQLRTTGCSRVRTLGRVLRRRLHRVFADLRQLTTHTYVDGTPRIQLSTRPGHNRSGIQGMPEFAADTPIGADVA